jgi:hypothetical protein
VKKINDAVCETDDETIFKILRACDQYFIVPDDVKQRAADSCGMTMLDNAILFMFHTEGRWAVAALLKDAWEKAKHEDLSLSMKQIECARQ